ncbi:MAG: LamG domain-containing protein, partial [Tepidisphaeraceae bacterium]
MTLLEQVAGQPRKPVVDLQGPYAEQTLAAKPIAYWRMNEFGGPALHTASGDIRDATAESGVLFYLQGPQAAAFSTESQINRALHFAGGRVTAELKDLGPAYTVDLWFWNGLPGEARAVAGYLISRGSDKDASATGDHLGIGGTSVAQDHLIFFNGNKSNEVLSGASKISPKTWNNVVLVRDGAQVNVYLNGNAQPDITGEIDVTVPAGTGRIFLGGRNDNLFNLEGKLDEVAIFNRALTAEEATARYKLTGLPVSKPPVSLVPPRSPEAALRSFKVKDGFEVELVAAEPLVM